MNCVGLVPTLAIDLHQVQRGLETGRAADHTVVLRDAYPGKGQPYGHSQLWKLVAVRSSAHRFRTSG